MVGSEVPFIGKTFYPSIKIELIEMSNKKERKEGKIRNKSKLTIRCRNGIAKWPGLWKDDQSCQSTCCWVDGRGNVWWAREPVSRKN